MLVRFLASESLRSFMAFIKALNSAVEGRTLSEDVHISSTVAGIQAALTTLDAWVDEIPPAQQSLRYGNPAYRSVQLLLRPC